MVQCQNTETKMLIYNCGQYPNKPLICPANLNGCSIWKKYSRLWKYTFLFILIYFWNSDISHKYLSRYSLDF